MSSYNLNYKLKSSQAKVYNLSSDIAIVFEVYLLPTCFSPSVSGYNEIANNKLWLLIPHANTTSKISVLLDGNVIPFKYDLPGESSTNPYIYRRSTSPSPISTSAGTINPLYGNDSTVYGTDWMRKINNGTELLSDLLSSPASGNFEFNATYFADHQVNKNLNDYITFDVQINDGGNSGLIPIIQQQLYDCTFVIHESIFNRNTTNGFDLLYSNLYKAYNDSEFGVRF